VQVADLCVNLLGFLVFLFLQNKNSINLIGKLLVLSPKLSDVLVELAGVGACVNVALGPTRDGVTRGRAYASLVHG